MDTRAHRQQGDLISLLSFFQNKESRIKIVPVSILKCLHNIAQTLVCTNSIYFRFTGLSKGIKIRQHREYSRALPTQQWGD
jgi:hypothetical protein